MKLNLSKYTICLCSLIPFLFPLFRHCMNAYRRHRAKKLVRRWAAIYKPFESPNQKEHCSMTGN